MKKQYRKPNIMSGVQFGETVVAVCGDGSAAGGMCQTGTSATEACSVGPNSGETCQTGIYAVDNCGAGNAF